MGKKNRGSAVIEMSLLMPILLGCIYLYIMLFLFLLESGKGMEYMVENMYEVGNTEKDTSEYFNDMVSERTEGNVKIYRIEEKGELFDLYLEMRRDENDAVENIRRWQLVTSIF